MDNPSTAAPDPAAELELGQSAALSEGPPDTPRPGAIGAFVRGLCPQCRQASIFAGWFGLRSVCPHCGLRLVRELGYYTGAMVLEFFTEAAIFLVVVALLRVWLAPVWPMTGQLAVAGIVVALLAPLCFRYARVFWLYFDRMVDP